MKLILKNIGMVRSASVEINGITVIAGENDTGKSTVGKALFAVFNSFCNIDEKIEVQRVDSVRRKLEASETLSDKYKSGENAIHIAYNIIKDDFGETDIDRIERLYKYMEGIKEITDDGQADRLVNQIEEVLNVPDVDIFKIILNKKFHAEFNSQITNIFSEGLGEVQLIIQDQVISIKFGEKDIADVNGKINLKTEAVYIDDPFVLDEAPRLYLGLRAYGHRARLAEKLDLERKSGNVIDEIVANNKLEKIYEKIATICDGDIIKRNHVGWGYKKPNTDKVLDIKNLSTGLKTFVILKTLLLNGTIEYNGTIILDEPEIHLHPEWQLLLAELIVLIHQEFGVHILLNTHSPYFLNAIEVYAAKYGVADKCKYYATKTEEDGSYIEDVTENVDAIYRKLARPLQVLENERWSND